MKISKSKLEMIMAEQCLTAENLAKLTGVSQVTIARMKRGVQNGRPATLGKISKALNVPVRDLLED